MFSNPTLANSSPQSKVLAREEFMRIQGMLDEGKNRGIDSAAILEKCGIAAFDLAAAGHRYALQDSTHFTAEQFESLQKTLYQDDIDRSTIYREKFIPTYDDFVDYERRLGDFYSEFALKNQKPNVTESEQYAFYDILDPAVDEFHKQNGLTTTAYHNISEYWRNWKREQDIIRFKSVFATPEDFFVFYMHVLDFIQQRFHDDLSDEAQSLAEQEYVQLLGTRGYDYVSWVFAEYYGVEEYLNPEQQKAVKAKREILYDF
jgi:hypothetical protein